MIKGRHIPDRTPFVNTWAIAKTAKIKNHHQNSDREARPENLFHFDRQFFVAATKPKICSPLRGLFLTD
jgi:hypothetical protein